MRTFEDLLRQRTKEDYLTQALDGLQGRGPVSQRGLGMGTMEASGLPTEAASLVVEVTTSGVLGTAQVQVSTDGGDSFDAPFTLPANGTVTPSGLGVTLQFENATDVAAASFVAGDTFSVELTPPAFSVTSWQPGSVPRKLLESDAEANAERDTLDRDIAAGGWLEYADPDLPDSSPAGPWLRLLARSRYGVTARTGTQARGMVVLTDSAGAGPFSIAAGDLWVATAGGLRYTNVGAGTLAKSSTLTLEFAAEALGEDYNAGNNTITQLLTVRPGVTVNNPAVGATGTWLTAQGTNPETQGNLRTRCYNRWPALGRGSPAESYQLTAQEASAQVTRVRVVTSTTSPGTVNVYLAGSGGGLIEAEVEAVQEALEVVSPLPGVPVASSAVPLVVTLEGTVKVRAAQLATAQTTAETNLSALFASLPIGGDTDAGSPGILDRESLLSAIAPQGRDGRSATGVVSVSLTAPAADVELEENEVATLTNNLVWEAV